REGRGGREGVEDRPRAVGRRVVGHHELGGRDALASERCELLLEEARPVVRREGDRERGHRRPVCQSAVASARLVSSLALPHSRFLHLPKTGGTWASRAMPAAGVAVRPLRASRPTGETIHASLAEVPRDGTFTFAFVRHPLDWWRSVWVHQMRYGWADAGPPLAALRSEDFETFIGRVCAEIPGHAGRVFEAYVG